MLIEGMACGRPAVAARSLGPAAIIDEGRSAGGAAPGPRRWRERYSWEGAAEQVAAVLAEVAAFRTPRRARNDITDATDAADPIESTEANEPIEPIESAEPTEPIDNTEPCEPIDNSESFDQSDHFEVPVSTRVRLPVSGATGRI